MSRTDVEWVVSTKGSSADAAGKISDQENRFPHGISIAPGTPGLDSSELLLTGEVDAFFFSATPAACINGDTRIVRLFPDFPGVEQNCFQRTGVFSIMHVLAIRRDMAAADPWLASAVFDAYSAAKFEAYRTR